MQSGDVVIANDCVWYDGVWDELALCIEKGAIVLISNFIYSNKLGEHTYPDGEGKYKIFNKDGITYVENKPNGNDSTYMHPTMNYPITPVT